MELQTVLLFLKLIIINVLVEYLICIIAYVYPTMLVTRNKTFISIITSKIIVKLTVIHLFIIRILMLMIVQVIKTQKKWHIIARFLQKWYT